MTSEIALATVPWGRWLVLAVLGACLVLDDTAWAQTWFSQPLPAATLAGFVCGDPLLGATVGLPMQLAVLANLPVGQGFVSEPAAVSVAVVGAAWTHGVALEPLAALGIGSGASLLGWLSVGAALAGLMGHVAVQAERRAHFFWMLAGRQTLRDGELRRIDGLQARCLATTAVRGAVQTVVLLAAATWVWLPLRRLLPTAVDRGLAWVPPALVGVALGVAVARYRIERIWPWLLFGGALGYALTELVQ